MRERTVTAQEPRLDEKRLLDIGELCLYLGIGRTNAIYLAKAQEFEVRIGSRVLYDRHKIDRWCDEQSGILEG